MSVTTIIETAVKGSRIAETMGVTKRFRKPITAAAAMAAPTRLVSTPGSSQSTNQTLTAVITQTVKNRLSEGRKRCRDPCLPFDLQPARIRVSMITRIIGRLVDSLGDRSYRRGMRRHIT